MDEPTLEERMGLITDTAKINLINLIIADYAEFGDADKDARGTLLAIMTVASYGRDV